MRTKKRIVYILLIILLFVLSRTLSKKGGLPKESTSSGVVVSRVIDGDTIELTTGERVRYIGIDTPEASGTHECFSDAATKENKRLVEGKTVRLEKDVSETDTYQRLLRYVYVDNQMVNDVLVRQGFARVSTFPPDVTFADQFVAAEKEARDHKRGLWGGCP